MSLDHIAPGLVEKLDIAGLKDSQFVDDQLVEIITRLLGDELRSDIQEFVQTYLLMLSHFSSVKMDADRLNIILTAGPLAAISQLQMVPDYVRRLMSKRMQARLDSMGKKTASIISKLVKIANELDARGFFKAADAIDNILMRGGSYEFKGL